MRWLPRRSGSGSLAREDVRGLALVARGKEQLQKLRSEITNIAPTATVEIVQADLGSMTDIERLAAITLEACGGRLDILVNNEYGHAS